MRNIAFPGKALVLLIRRGADKIVPKGYTIIQEGDNITMSLPESQADDKIELREFIVDRSHPWCNKKIKELNIAKNIMIVMIKREGKHIVPNGETMFKEGDLVVLYL